jgi:hypothetical protein
MRLTIWPNAKKALTEARRIFSQISEAALAPLPAFAPLTAISGWHRVKWSNVASPANTQIDVIQLLAHGVSHVGNLLRAGA